MMSDISQVAIDYPEWCWKETEQTVTVEDELEVPAFEQSGIIIISDSETYQILLLNLLDLTYNFSKSSRSPNL